MNGNRHTQSPKNATSKRRWSAADTLIVLALILAIAGILVRAFVSNREEASLADGGPFEVHFTVAEIHTSVLADIHASDTLYFYDTDEAVGYIGFYQDGSIALSQTGILPSEGGELVTAQGCLVCPEGTLSEGGLLPVGATRYLAPGSVVTLRTDRGVLTVEITKIVERE